MTQNKLLLDSWTAQLYDEKQCDELLAQLEQQSAVEHRPNNPRTMKNGKIPLRKWAVEEQATGKTEDGKVSFPDYPYPGFQYGKVVEWRPIVKKMRDRVDALTKQSSTFANVKKYPPDASMDWHQDKTSTWKKDTGVAILSLGFTRQLQIGRKAQTAKGNDKFDVVATVDMLPGMVFFLGPETNKTYFHRVKPLAKGQQARAGCRWSLQFREIVVYGAARAEQESKKRKQEEVATDGDDDDDDEQPPSKKARLSDDDA